MNPQRPEVVARACDALLDVVPYLRTNLRHDACIGNTRVGIELLQLFGVRAEPLVCKVVVANAAARKRRDLPAGANEAGPHVPFYVQVGFTGLTIPHRWDAHMVIHAPPYLVDLTLDQASRPEHGIILRPMRMTLHMPPTCGQQYVASFESGAWFNLEVRHDAPPYHDGPGWCCNYGPVVGHAAGLMAEALSRRLDAPQIHPTELFTP